MNREFPDWAVLVDPPPVPEWKFFMDWLARGHQAGLDYLDRTAMRRRSLSDGYPGYRTIILALLPHDSRAFLAKPGPDAAEIARYAVGEDYHTRFEKAFGRVLSVLDGHLPSNEKPLVKPDHGAILEKSLAEKAGLGRVGKNTLLIHPRLGSWLTIGCLLLKTPLKERRGSSRAGDPCGQCTRCLEACPTGAFAGPHDLNSGRCISYLTIERPSDSGADLRKTHGERWLFGCDRCQEVCPHNGDFDDKDSSGLDEGRFVPLLEATEESVRGLRKMHGALSRVPVQSLLGRIGEIRQNIASERR